MRGCSRKCSITSSAVLSASMGLKPPLDPDFHRPCGNVLEANGWSVARVEHAREGDQLIVVEVAVRERDERLTAASVVPAKSATWHP